MKFLAVSDLVVPHLYTEHVRVQYPDIDYVLGCGDLPFYYLEFLQSALDARVFYVRGNHDQSPQFTSDGRILTEVDGGIDIHGRVVNIDGLLVAGLEGSMRYRPNVPYMYTENEMRWQIYQLLPRLTLRRMKHGRPLDILITHSPPKDIHDRPDLPHTGFQVFLTLLNLIKPKLMIHGHVHLNQKTHVRTVFDETTIINVYPNYTFEAQFEPQSNSVELTLPK